MARGAIVITDRSYYSSAAYQGARGFLVEAILAENEAFAPRPDRVLFLDLPLDVALERCARRGSDAFERAEELAAVQRNYWRLARERSFYVVSTDGAEATVSASIMEVVGSWS
jgi:dTMP kinase